MTISNDLIRLTVNPSVGRIVDFGAVDGPNLLRITDASVLTEGKQDVPDYQGYGGDQLWPAQQAMWGDIRGSGGTWPPLDELDGPNWQILDQGPLHVTIQSPQTPLLGLIAERRIEVSPDAARVSITNKFTRAVIPNPNQSFPVNIWSVTGVVEPEFVMSDLSPDRPAAPRDWVTLIGTISRQMATVVDDGNALRFDNQLHGPGQSPADSAAKLGTYGDWLAAVYADVVFLQQNNYDPDGTFPDGASLEIFSSQTTGSEYAELEVLSTSVDLGLGEMLSNRVDWLLLPRPPGLTDDQLARYLESIPEPSSVALLSVGALLLCCTVRRNQRARSRDNR